MPSPDSPHFGKGSLISCRPTGKSALAICTFRPCGFARKIFFFVGRRYVTFSSIITTIARVCVPPALLRLEICCSSFSLPCLLICSAHADRRSVPAFPRSAPCALARRSRWHGARTKPVQLSDLLFFSVAKCRVSIYHTPSMLDVLIDRVALASESQTSLTGGKSCQTQNLPCLPCLHSSCKRSSSSDTHAFSLSVCHISTMS